VRSPRGAKRLVADALKTVRNLPSGPARKPLLRADSALCRYRHNADYAEVLVMPMLMPNPLVGVVIDRLRSA
jgi:hypothetical protein